MKHSLQLKLGTQLTMTPQLQQAIRLLQLSTLDLQNEIQEALENNPMLEVTEDSGASDSSGDAERASNAQSELPAESETPVKAAETSPENTNDANESAASDDWSENIPTDLAVDTSWDDIYQSGSSGSGLSRPENEDFDYDSRNASADGAPCARA